MSSEVRHDADRSRFELVVDGEVVGVADYYLDGERLVFPHTEITPSRRGQGLGAELVRGALDQVRAQGHRIEARCWYVAQFIDEHPEYRSLLAA